MLVYAPGSNIVNFHFMWKLPSDVEVVECFQRSQSAVEEAKKKIPKFHSRAIKVSSVSKVWKSIIWSEAVCIAIFL